MLAKIDWLTSSYTMNASSSDPIPLGIGFAASRPKDTEAARFDTEQTLYPAGTAYTKHGDDPLTILQFTGDDMRTIRAQENLQDLLLRHIITNATNVTRIDIAIDSENPNASPAAALKAYNWGIADTRIKTVTEYKQHKDTGHTVYFGSPKGDAFVRCYDKAAELKLPERHITRLEMQLRKKRANPFMQDIKQHGLQAAAHANIRKIIDFPDLAWWREMVEQNDIEPTQIPRNLDKWVYWLDNQVSAAIDKKAAANDPDHIAAILRLEKRIQELIPLDDKRRTLARDLESD